MKITAFGIIWLCTFFVYLAKRRKWGMISLTLLTMIFQSNNFLIIGNTGIGVQICAVLFLILVLIINNKGYERTYNQYQGRGKRVHILKIFIFLIMASILISLAGNGVALSEAFIPVMMIFVYVLLAWILLSKRVNVTREEIEKLEDKLVIIIAIVGFLQILCKLGLPLLKELLTILVYNDTTNTNVIFHTKPLAVFYSTFMEPSYCGAMLVGLFALFAMREKKKKNMFLTILLMIIIVLTRSSTAYAGLAIVLAIMFLTSKEKKIYHLILPIVLMGVAFMLIFYSDVLNTVLFEKNLSASYRVRMRWNTAAGEAFLTSPLIGVGYGNLRASSLIYCILGEQGIIGLSSYAMFILYFVRKIFSKFTDGFIKSHAWLVLGVSVGQALACPDLNFSPFWLSLYLYILAFYSIENSKGEELYENRDSNISSGA